MDFIKKKKSKFFLILALRGVILTPKLPFSLRFLFFSAIFSIFYYPSFLVDLKAYIEIALYEYMKGALKNKFFLYFFD